MLGAKKLPALFYATPSGTEPVREWLKSLDAKERRTIGRGIATAEYGWPLCRPLGRGLYEIRSNIGDGRIARVIFIRERAAHGAVTRFHQEIAEGSEAGH